MAGLVEFFLNASHRISEISDASDSEIQIDRVFSLDDFQQEDGSVLFSDGLADLVEIKDLDGKVRSDERKYVEFVGVDGSILILHSLGTDYVAVSQLNDKGLEKRTFNWAPLQEKPSDRMSTIEVAYRKQMRFKRHMHSGGSESVVYIEGDVDDNSLTLHLGNNQKPVKIRYVSDKEVNE